MPLELYRRHSDRCSGKYHLKPNPQEFTRCNCPVYCYGWVDGVEVRRSMKTRDMGRAEKWLKESTAEPAASGSAVSGARTLLDAHALFLAECETRRLAERTICNYKGVLKNLLGHYGATGPVTALTLDSLTVFRQTLRNRGKRLTYNGSVKVVKILRLFCAFLHDREWLPNNPAKKLRPPIDDSEPTQPFEPEQQGRIIAAIKTPRERALILTLLYTGLRISDAYMLRRDQVDFKRQSLLFTTRKTKTKNYTHIHEDLAEALQALPNRGIYFFWDGTGGINCRTQRSRREVMRVLDRAQVAGHPHMFRDTFAVELLNNGEDIRTVQLLLGHKSVQTTEKHYAPWVRSFQDRLDTAVRKLSFCRLSVPPTPARPPRPVSAESGVRAA